VVLIFYSWEVSHVAQEGGGSYAPTTKRGVTRHTMHLNKYTVSPCERFHLHVNTEIPFALQPRHYYALATASWPFIRLRLRLALSMALLGNTGDLKGVFI
jgi:hypothetical protein